MADDIKNHIQHVVNTLEDVELTLKKVSETCCMPERSHQMNEIFTGLRHVLSELTSLQSASQELNSCVEHISHCGSKIGDLLYRSERTFVSTHVKTT